MAGAYTLPIWFNFLLGWFFKQKHLLCLIILGGYAKDDPDMRILQNKNWCSSKSNW